MKPFKIFENHDNLIAEFSSAQDGNMDVRFGDEAGVYSNRMNFYKNIGIDESRLVQATLVHGDDIVEVTEEYLSNKTPIECDALITRAKDIYLAFRTADCLPIFYFDPVKQVVALAHCGWQSTDKHLAEKVVQKMTGDFGCETNDILVAMGPAIHKESYIFLESEAQAKEHINFLPYIHDLPNGYIMIDNIRYNIDQLMGAGISLENIESSKIDTGQSSEYFSHYRAKRSGTPDGRFINVIGLKTI